MTLTLDELTTELAKRIEARESRKRARTAQEQRRFVYSIRVLLSDIWKANKCMPARECSINKRAGWYSEHDRYRDPSLSYKQTISAFNGLLGLELIEVTQEGYFDRELCQGQLTRFVPKDELIERVNSLDGHPAITLIPSLNSETIILRKKVNGKNELEDYKDSPNTELYRSNLIKINSCFLRHWFDLEIKDSEVCKLEKRIANHSTKQPIDFSQRTLVRIFANGSFQEGGRYYRGWWQNVPSEYRKYITIDEKRTAEFDFSQLNPHLLYHRNHKELGSEDAYDRVLDGAHRKVVKQAFNAMVQAQKPLNSCPSDLDLSEVEMTWTELRNKIVQAHKPISDLFFKGVGNHLQFVDSQIAERIMLHFASIDAPALPVHDSFIAHHAFGESGELEEAMRRAYYEVIGEHISKIDKEILTWTYRKDDPITDQISELNVDQILQADNDVSEWRKRQNIWYAHREANHI